MTDGEETSGAAGRCVRVFWVRCEKTWAAAAAERMTVTSSEAPRRPLHDVSATITKPSRVVVPASRADQLKCARSFRIVIAIALPFMVPQLPPPTSPPPPIVVITHYYYIIYTVCLDNDHF